MALTALQLADLRGKAKLYLGISDDDPAFQIDALAVYDDLTNNTTSTIQVTNTGITLVGDDEGTDTVTFAGLAADTLEDLRTSLLAANANLQITILAADEVAATDLVRLAPVNIAGQSNEKTLKAENAALLDLLIEGTLAGIEAFLGRNLFSATYRERVYPSSGLVTFKQPNVTRVDQFSVDPDDAIAVTYSGSDTMAHVEVSSASVILRSFNATTTTTSLSRSTYSNTATMAAAIDAVSGWSATARVTVPTDRLIDTPAWDAKDTSVELQYWTDYDGEYEVDYEEGQLRIRIPSYTGGIWYRGMGSVLYQAGYTELPRDIEQVLLTLIKSSYDATKRDGSVIAERLGDYSYQLAQESLSGGVSKANIASQLAVLDRYRRMLP